MRNITPSPNRLLWQFVDAVAPTSWKSKQAKRIYDAAVAAEKSGQWMDHAVVGSVRCISHKNDVPELREPQFGTNSTDASIETRTKQHIADLRRHADKLEAVLAAYGPGTFRKQSQQMRAPAHPFDAEAEIFALLRGDHDEIIVHGVRFVRDSSGAFVAD